MINHLFRSAFLLLLVVTMTTLWAQESEHKDKPEDGNPAPRLESVFSDDFGKDTRGDYTIQGDVSWEKGKLALGKGASIQRAINGGAWAKVELDVDLPELTAEQPHSDVQVWFLLDGTTDCIVVLHNDDRHMTTVALVDVGEKEEEHIGKVVRRTQLKNLNINRLGIEYRHGLVQVSANNRPVLVSHVSNETAVVAGCRVRVAIASAGITRLAASSTPPACALSARQQEQLARVKAALTVMLRLNREGKFAEAARVAQEMLRIRKSVLGEQHPDYAQSLNDLAGLYYFTGDYSRAELLYKKAIAIRKSVLGELHPDYVSSLNGLASLYLKTDDYPRAESLLKQVMAIRKSVLGEQHPSYATSLNNLACLYQRMGDYARAEPLFKQAMAIDKSVLGEQHPSYASSLNNLAALYVSTGDYARAELLFTQALEIRQSVLGEQHPGYASSLSHLAGLYEKMGDYARAMRLYKKAMAIRKSVLGEQHPGYASSLNDLAGLYEKMGDFARAEPLFKQALAIRKAVLGEQHSSYATSLNNLAVLYRHTGDYVRAFQLNMQAMAIIKSVQGNHHSNFAGSLNNLADLCCLAGEFDLAESLFKQVIEISKVAVGEHHPIYATSLNNLAGLYEEMDDFARAEPLYKQAMAITKSVLGEKHPRYASCLNHLAGLYDGTGDYARAQSLLTTALPIVRQQLDSTSLVQSERQQKRMQSENRHFIDSWLSHCVRATRDPNFVAQQIWQWKGAVTLRQQAYRQVAVQPKLAPLFADLRSVSGQLSVASGRVPVPPPVSASTTAHATFKRKRELWEQRFAALNHRREDLEQQIAAGSQPFRRIRQSLTVAAVQSTLSQGTALVDFLEYYYSEPDVEKKGKTNSEHRYIAFVVRNDAKTAMIPLGSAKSLTDLITTFRRPIVDDQNPDTLKTAVQAGQRLRNALWLPIEKHLAGVDTVIISPDTALGTLPFAALPGKKNGSYLIQDYRIAGVPMANLLPALYEDDAAKPRRKGLLVLGDVDYNAEPSSSESGPETPQLLAVASEQGRLARSRGGKSRQWVSLPGFHAELETVRSLYEKHFGSNAPVATLSGKQATEASFLEAAAHVGTLHLITHGYFEDARVKSIDQAEVKPDAISSEVRGLDPFVNTWMPGLLSGLVLAGANRSSSDPDNPSDGILRASEIEVASLRGVDLVVLSACETGLGAVAGGEGLTGLQRAFQIAGARTVVASLWKVDDRATQELMRRFYTNLWQKQMSKLDALRDAQLWMLRHPERLETLGVKDARTRGEVRRLKPTRPKASPQPQGNRTAPYYWAAFQLSGDWR